ncbi:MAG TPA: hypothetical protein VHW23_39290 [Kofleriaceae bacterium]|nr:hypothetical protein [Kofleriaceae bacterium]
MTRLVVIAMLCASAVAAAQPAVRGADTTKASAAYARGSRQYAEGDYRAAAASFLEAHAADPDPAYLFNIGQAFRFAHDCVQAARYYREFLGAVSSAPNLDKVRGYLAEMDACVRGEPAPPTPSTLPSAPTSPPPAPPSARAAPAAPDDSGATRRVGGLALGGAGLAAVGVGIWFQHDVAYFEDRSHRCTREAPCPAAQVAHWDDRGHLASVVAITAYAAGGAALVGGAALYLFGRRRDAEPPVAIAPAPGGALVTAGFAF